MNIRKWRKMTWVLWIWCALILAWAIGAGASNDCAAEAEQLSRDACAAGTGIGIAIVLFVGFFGFVFFGLIWFMTRPRHRTCPRCGEDVKKGHVECSSCGQQMGQPVAAQ